MEYFNDRHSLISKRLNKLINSCSVNLKKEFDIYFSKISWKEGLRFSLSNGCNKTPFWFILPIQLFEKYKHLNKKKNINMDFLNDILWAQFCLFMFIRIRDDILDTKQQIDSLLIISDLFLIESEKSIGEHFSRSSQFWNLFYSLKEESITAMFEKANLESVVNSKPQNILNCHGLEGSILNIATAAICSKYQKLKDFNVLKSFTYNIVVAGQIIDDLFDIEEDLHNGCYNYALLKLLPPRKIKCKSVEHIEIHLVESILRSDKFNIIINEIYDRIIKGEEIINNLELPISKIIVSNYKHNINFIKKKFHQKRVEAFFKNEYKEQIEEFYGESQFSAH